MSVGSICAARCLPSIGTWQLRVLPTVHQAMPLQLSMYNTRRPIDADATAEDMHNCVFPAPLSPTISNIELDGKPSVKRSLIAVHPVLHTDTFGGAPEGVEIGIAEGKIVRHDMVTKV